jgi:hypothetical protein
VICKSDQSQIIGSIFKWLPPGPGGSDEISGGVAFKFLSVNQMQGAEMQVWNFKIKTEPSPALRD